MALRLLTSTATGSGASLHETVASPLLWCPKSWSAMVAWWRVQMSRYALKCGSSQSSCARHTVCVHVCVCSQLLLPLLCACRTKARAAFIFDAACDARHAARFDGAGAVDSQKAALYVQHPRQNHLRMCCHNQHWNPQRRGIATSTHGMNKLEPPLLATAHARPGPACPRCAARHFNWWCHSLCCTSSNFRLP
jgi:hypothetical protein